MPSTDHACYRVGDLLVDPGQRRVERDGHEIALTGLTFDLLLVLAREAPNLASNDVLMQQVWPGRVVSPETVSQRIKLLRAALGDDPDAPRYLGGVRGHGYRLLVPVERCSCTTRPAISPGPAAGAEAPLVLVSASIAPAPAATPSRRMTRGWWLLALGLIIAVSIWLVWPDMQSPPVSSSTDRATDASSHSIAVLPFRNRSRLADDALFVDGLHDDILTQVSKVSALKVISRTSVERFRDTKLPIGDIARQLGVTTILECAVQRAGGRVRINVQLIDAATDQHLWAENYDRELTAANIFAIQSEVAAAIAGALEVTLTPAEQARVDSLPTRNLEAWTAYHVGWQQMSKRTSQGLADAAQAFEHAIELDPAFALPYAALADTLFLQTDKGTVPRAAGMERAEEMLSEALRLDPELPEALTTAAKFAELRGDYAAAEASYRRAISLNPNYTTAHHWYGLLLTGLGRNEEGLRMVREAVELDPLSPVLRLVYGQLLGAAGRYEEQQVQLDMIRAIDPALPGSYAVVGTRLARKNGRLDEAVPWLERAAELDAGSTFHAVEVAAVFLDLEDYESARRWLARATTSGSVSDTANEVAAILELYSGQPGQAAAFARRLREQRPFVSWHGWDLRLLRDADLRNGRPDDARARYAAIYPELLGSDTPRLIGPNHLVAIDFAFVLQLTGEREAAARLLDGSEAVLRRRRLLGELGYGVEDARIFALRGEKRLALEALREAVESHWRGPYWRYYRDFDPILASIRTEPEFKAAFTDIELDMAAQRARVAARPADAPLVHDSGR